MIVHIVIMFQTLISLPLAGQSGDPEQAKQFILQLFLSVIPEPYNKCIRAHFTHAMDTKNFKKVFEYYCEHLLEQNLKDHNLM